MLTPETLKLLGSTKKDVDKDKNIENVPKLGSVEVVLVPCNHVRTRWLNFWKCLERMLMQ